MLKLRKRTILEIIAVVAVLGVLSIFVFLRGSDERWTAMNTRITELRAEARSRKPPRTVLHGTPVEGNAWDDYQIALNDAQTWKEDPNGAMLGRFANLILSGKLTQAQLADLEKKLETLDHDFPSIRTALTNDSLLGMDPTAEASIGEWFQLTKQGGWRYGFSTRGVALAAFEERESYMRRTKNLEKTNFGTAKKEADALEAELASSTNPITRMSTPSITRTIEAHGEPLARLRLLRAATGFLVTGKVPTVPDPFGTNLLYDDKGEKVKMWSVGSDGIDQKASGVWSIKPRQLDIVIEIPK